MLLLLLKILGTIAIFNTMLLAHEGAHLLTARWFKIPIESFSIGFGKVLANRSFRGVRYELRLIPLGGFVRLAPPEDGPEAVGLYGRTSAPGIAIVTLSGVIANFAVAYLAFVGSLLARGWDFVPALGKAGWAMKFVATDTFTGFIGAVQSTFADPGGDNGLMGPLGISQVLGDNFGSPVKLLLAIGLISMGIGLFNLLPLPFLDGGQCLFGLYQHFRKQAIESTTLRRISLATVAVLTLLFFLTTSSDVVRFFR